MPLPQIQIPPQLMIPPPGLAKVLSNVTPQAASWRHIRRIKFGAASVDTTAIGDFALPAQGIHAKIIASDLIDTTANTVGSFQGLQVILGGAVVVGSNYHWVDWLVANTAGVITSGGTGSGASDVGWGPIVTT